MNPFRRDVHVIIGAGLTGMAISRSLSARQIRHVLIGAPPTTNSPILGESLNVEATLDVDRMFPDLRKHLYQKSYVTFHAPTRYSVCDLDITKTRAAPLFPAMGFPCPARLWHIDRPRFDAELFASVVSSPHCEFVNARVEAIQSERHGDAVTGIVLADRAGRIEPRFVFDASGPSRILGRALGVRCHTHGESHRTIFTHLRRQHSNPDPRPAADEAWRSTTTLVRLYSAIHGLDGMGWCIPIDDYISVGLSVPSSAAAQASEDRAITLLAAALRAVGIPVDDFPLTTRTVCVPNEHYFHDRAFGQNWLLAGTSYAQIWFSAGSGIATSLMAAEVAPRVAQEVRTLGPRYEELFRAYELTHVGHEAFRRLPAEPSDTDLHYITDLITIGTLRRLCLYAELRESVPARLGARILARLIDLGLVRADKFCTIHD